MQLGLELYALKAVNIMDDHKILMKIEVNGRVMEESIGEDSYEFFGMITGGKRLSAIGRKKRYTYGDLVGIFEAEPATCINFMFLDAEDEINLVIETNVWLDPGLFVQDVMLKIYSENRTLEIPLSRPDIRMAWPKRGLFVIDIGTFVRVLYAERRIF
ncbi:hypothetical protein [Thermoanaerobacterium sp. DL9XJH110]|uniref:hypothetical protein n=1 Tax=Thermoanaerobacterium sp. DL9XJH110 TaxID=3386643 RepID=UPI003BB67520